MTKPLHIAQFLAYLNFDGVGNSVLNLIRRSDPKEFHHVVFGHVLDKAYTDELGKLNCAFHHTPHPYLLWTYRKKFLDLARLQAQLSKSFHIMHSHFVPVGAPLKIAAAAQIPVRIAHSHTALVELSTKPWPLNAIGGALSRHLTQKYATHGIAVGEAAAEAKFGSLWRQDPRWRIMPLGLDFKKFDISARHDFRSTLGLPPSAKVIGHVGRLATEKNHGHLLMLFKEVLQLVPDAWLLLVGEGPLRESLQNQVKSLGVSSRVIFLGNRHDIPQLLLSAMDVFVFPSLYEGQPLALAEAQAAGLPCIVSTSVPQASDFIPELITRLDLKAPLEEWAHATSVKLGSKVDISKQDCLVRALASPLNIDRSAQELLKFYKDVVLA